MNMTPIALRNDAISTAKRIFESPDKYAILDTETTGLGKYAEIIEMTVLSPAGEQLFSGCFQPKGDISPGSTARHGLDAKTLKAKGAVPYADAHSELLAALEGRVIIAYNAHFDAGMIENTANLWGLEPPVGDDGYLCALALRRRYDSNLSTYRLDGDHSSLGDCKALLELLREMANAELAEDPDAMPIESIEELISLNTKLEEMSAQRIAITKQETIIKNRISQYFIDGDQESVLLGDGRKLWLVAGFKSVKSKVPMDELPSHYTQLSLSRKSLNAEFKAKGELNKKLFDFEESYSIKAKKI